jgi:hypothetical protein
MFRVSKSADFPWSRYHTLSVPDCAACPLCLFSHVLSYCFNFRHLHVVMTARLATYGTSATRHSLSQTVGTRPFSFASVYHDIFINKTSISHTITNQMLGRGESPDLNTKVVITSCLLRLSHISGSGDKWVWVMVELRARHSSSG